MKRFGLFLLRVSALLSLLLFACCHGQNLRSRSQRVSSKASRTTATCRAQFVLQRTIDLGFNPAYLALNPLSEDHSHQHSKNHPETSLFVSSFYNVDVAPNGTIETFERDLVAQVTMDERHGSKSRKRHLKSNNVAPVTVQVLTDVAIPPNPKQQPQYKMAWPNEISKAPNGMFPFQALIIPQGFISEPLPGRLTAIDLDSPNHTEYMIHQSTELPMGPTAPMAPNNSPRFYHRVLYLDMNQDGRLDIVTVRSGMKVVPKFYPPFGELVWFENPGWAHLKPNVPWKEHYIYGGPVANFSGPDINLRSFDFDGDGIPEIVATHFFTGAKIALYGVPHGATSWKDVNGLDPTKQPRVAVISKDQGDPLDIEIVDLNGDGRMDILATNSEPDGIKYPSKVPGRVFALEQPASGKIFTDLWKTHILMDGIRPQPSLPIDRGSRLAPGRAVSFSPFPTKSIQRPWIVVGGDESGKVWILSPSATNSNDWVYRSEIMFDINVWYGPNTTQTILKSRHAGVAIHTIGSFQVVYHQNAATELFIPIYEADQILSFGVRHLLSSNSPKCHY